MYLRNFLQDSNVCCYARIDAKGTSYLLGDMSGHLLMLMLLTEENADGNLKVTPKVEVLGNALLSFLFLSCYSYSQKMLTICFQEK